MKSIRLIYGCISLLGMACLGITGSSNQALADVVVSTSAPGNGALQISAQDQVLSDQAQTWINQLTTLQAKFQQIAPDGQRSTGVVWIKKPGRIRFEYNKPSELLLVANDGKMVFHDAEVGQTTTIPLDQSPLGLLLKPQLSFSGDVTVTNFIPPNNGLFQITVVRTASPSDGSLTLIFNQNPIMLKAWRVLDAQGRTTMVDLYDLQPGVSVKNKLFKMDFGDNE
ncbi:outer membrane lipoprotein carrier protein LolA [Commensalibacter papalotli (ex Botero et al. 2024)]|uniref:Outer membrane lipoprotein-sorting protein (LolA) (PDB:1IWL) n=1 Tax=Commensalibacter papalotli (ex Botero et al. 2024) TaxID=2972766 RepID=A0ABM9HRJ9_9PROT|nr:outer membrane lipoprotein carrier protein LolA [Commensalibacter papalotli (ex Botero et al. 2024)]CAI3941576.1 Outer membrane lipoprotein-sorting protein (LolA) (PDB:1IWL) [Commensalibacter papalotli (ex Botero et al. 2024)]CAI3949391.1 Outer membrane lipoprotein-sorting protein (LolA) (PDB:1IWL) [Commensalibacter papalotli (ex Botero et al. 2024)]